MKKQGYTLIELLLGVTIAAMIFIGASSVMALLFRSDLKSKQQENIEQTKNDLLLEFTNAIRWAQEIDFTANNISTLTLDQNVYSVQSGRLTRNSDPLTPSSLTITKFSVKDYSSDSLTKSLEIIVDMENVNQATIKDTMKLVVSQRKTTFEQK